MKSIKELLLSTALYEKVPFLKEELEQLFELKFFNGTIDFQCGQCGTNSTFQGVNTFEYSNFYPVETYAEFLAQQRENAPSLLLNQDYIVNLECTRNREHKSTFIFKVTEDTIEKIGQYPSLVSLNQPEIKKYRKVLSSGKYEELNRGVGLITHGVGIGSFVYLRRIFESLIEEAHNAAKTEVNWDEGVFIGSRMDEKIELLKSHLPVFLSENKVIYGILSKGVHELSENECLEYFPVMKVGIELMLDEKLEAMEKNKKQEEAKKAFAMIKSKIGK